MAPAAPDRVYALIDAPEGGLYRSDDDGATWTKTSGDKRIWQRGWYFGELTVNPKNPDQIWVCDTIILRSDDGGHTFLPIKGDPTGDDFHALWIDPRDPDRRILGVDQGTLVTLNGGETWSSWFNQPTGQFYHVVTDDRFPYRVYGAQQDSGAAGVPSRTGSIDGIAMPNFHEVTAGGESDNIAPDPDDPDIVYGGRVDKLDLKSGQTRSVDPTLAHHPANDVLSDSIHGFLAPTSGRALRSLLHSKTGSVASIAARSMSCIPIASSAGRSALATSLTSVISSGFTGPFPGSSISQMTTTVTP